MNTFDTRFEPVQLDENTSIKIEVIDMGGQRQVKSGDGLNFQEVTDSIEKICKTLVEPIKKAAPKKATVEFGLAVGLESGKLTALWVKGHGTAHLNITLEWEYGQ